MSQYKNVTMRIVDSDNGWSPQNKIYFLRKNFQCKYYIKPLNVDYSILMQWGNICRSW